MRLSLDSDRIDQAGNVENRYDVEFLDTYSERQQL